MGFFFFADLLAPKKLIVEKINTSAIELTWFGNEDQADIDIVWCEAKSTTFTYQEDNSFIHRKPRLSFEMKTYLLYNISVTLDSIYELIGRLQVSYLTILGALSRNSH